MSLFCALPIIALIFFANQAAESEREQWRSGNAAFLTQELIANLPDVRREGMTGAAGRLQRDKALLCGGGQIQVLDRPQLESRVCERYRGGKKEYRRLPGRRTDTVLKSRKIPAPNERVQSAPPHGPELIAGAT